MINAKIPESDLIFSHMLWENQEVHSKQNGKKSERKALQSRHMRDSADDTQHSCKICLSFIYVFKGGNTSLLQCPNCQEVVHEKCMRSYINKTENPMCINCRFSINETDPDFLEDWEFKVDIFDSDDEDFKDIDYQPERLRRSMRLKQTKHNLRKRK